MSVILVQLDQDGGKTFDRAIRENTLRDAGDLKLITKDAGTVGGAACIALTFSVEATPGNVKVAQTVVSVQSLRAVLRIIDANHDDAGRRIHANSPSGDA